MTKLVQHLPSPALVVACVALVVALGGVSYAAVAIPPNSIGKAQLKKNAVNSAKVQDFSLLAKDFKSGELPAGPKGEKGDPGTANALVRTASATVAPSTAGTVSVSCSTGQRALGGGGGFSSPAATDDLAKSAPTKSANADPVDGEAATGWSVTARNGGFFSKSLRVYAICVAA